MKKYLLLIEDEKMWEKFKELIDKDINAEIIDLIKKKIEKESKWKSVLNQKEGKLQYS